MIFFLIFRQGDREKLSSKLFVLIASSDLLTNSYPALHILYFCLAPNINLSIQVDYAREVKPLFKQYVIPSLFTCFFGCLSQAFTAVLAVTRMVAIFKPFFYIPKWALVNIIENGRPYGDDQKSRFSINFCAVLTY